MFTKSTEISHHMNQVGRYVALCVFPHAVMAGFEGIDCIYYVFI